MKIRPSIFGFAVIVFILIALLLWYEKKKSVETSSATSSETNAAPSTATAPNQSVNQPVINTPIQTNAPMLKPVTNAPPAPSQSKWEQLQPILATQNDIPIDFYGRVEDQFGNAVADATVNFSIGVYNGYESTEKRGQVITDGNGFFTITGYNGQNLGVMPEKAGYTLATTGTLFKYSHLESHPYVSDQNNPTVIKMWKLQGAEHLVSFNIQMYIPVDGTPIEFNLQTGKQVQSSGDLIISVRSSLKPSVQEGYDWQASIQMADGGIIQDSSGLGLEKMFQAPDSGYAPEYNVSFQKGTQSWTSRFNDGFYFTSLGGKLYGKFALSIISDRVKDNAVPVTLNGYLNPAGSRNLEINSQ
jgi:protocatechuate 3,4-dioxygenase beta subunit